MSGVVVGGATIIITGFFLEEGIRALIKETTSCATRHVVCNAVTIGTGGTGIADGVTGDIKGMQVTGSNNYDGNVPSVVLYEEDGSELAFEEGHGKTKDPFPLATGHVPERQNGEPAYISVTSSGDDAICIAWVTVTSNTGSATTWTGDSKR
jgi:hypothetical protein